MATIRHHAHIDKSPDEVWSSVSDAGNISSWFPAIEESSLDGSTRSCTMAGGGELIEEIVTSDDELRRFQYRITDGAMKPDFHLGTIDVLEDGDGSLVIYSTEITPDELYPVMDKSIGSGLRGLKSSLEG